MTTLDATTVRSAAAFGRPGDLLLPLLAALARRLAARRALWATIEDLGQLSNRELADMGLSRGDIPGAAARAVRDAAPRLPGLF